MKLEVGMYVRTKEGIRKIKWFDKGEPILENDFTALQSTGYKASHNIIDLIQENDFVNGSKVIKTNCKLEYIDDDSDTGVNEVYDGLELENGWIYFEHEIESIVTKEQFESMSYKVGE